MKGDGLMQKVKCERTFILKPGHQPYFMERIPALKNIKAADAKRFGLQLYRPKKDVYGNKVMNPNSYTYPLIARAFARERVFSMHNPVCQKCKACVTR